ncbi:hypothetical protein BDR05DRAFT_951088 [Suillus weaverae]|nr:hypothetical protein BDR05DRAFT_951088 [Suillus weaverae]
MTMLHPSISFVATSNYSFARDAGSATEFLCIILPFYMTKAIIGALGRRIIVRAIRVELTHLVLAGQIMTGEGGDSKLYLVLWAEGWDKIEIMLDGESKSRRAMVVDSDTCQMHDGLMESDGIWRGLGHVTTGIARRTTELRLDYA